MSNRCYDCGNENQVISLTAGEVVLFTRCDHFLLKLMQASGHKVLMIHTGEVYLSDETFRHQIDAGHGVACNSVCLLRQCRNCSGILLRSELIDYFWEKNIDIMVLPSCLQILLRELFNYRAGSGLPPSRFYLRAKCHELLVQLIEWRFSTSKKYKFSKNDISCIEKAMEIVKQNIVNPPSLPDLAHLAGINETKLKRLFREYYGVPVFTFLKEFRLQQARYLIQSSALSIREISTKVGMRSGGYFSCVYRERFGVLPHEDRKS